MNCTYPYQVQATSPAAATGADFLEVVYLFFYVFLILIFVFCTISYKCVSILNDYKTFKNSFLSIFFSKWPLSFLRSESQCTLMTVLHNFLTYAVGAILLNLICRKESV